MKTAIGVVATMMITAMVAPTASAEWRLYVNRDNRAWSLERTYVSNDECDRAARTLYKSGQALGVGCAEYPQPQSAQPPAPRPAEYSRSSPQGSRQVARADDPGRLNASRSNTRVAEYPVRTTSSRHVAVAEAPAASHSHPAAVIFPPSGGIEIRPQEAPSPAVAPSPVKAEPKRQAAAVVAQKSSEVDVDKDSAAVALAKAAAEASAAPARETAAEASAREAQITADKADRRTYLAVFGGVTLVLGTGVAYSVYGFARTSPLRGLAVGLIELGVLTAALAYPVVEMWTKLKLSTAFALSTLPGVIAGLVVGGVGVIVLALDLTRKPSRPKNAVVPLPLPGAVPIPERKPQPPVEPLRPVEQTQPVEPLKPVEQAKATEPVKPAEPVRPLQPIRPLEAVHPLGAAKPVEPVKPPDTAAPVAGA